eukprot:TRINITY_DN54_c0_g1_i1.p1 TRINITY_DN54_c0_g1~~TRINITY_DN54_c0_g1_i1.p1  ORF type:complete len:399 (+),score=115.39 TRINITY_DN54_c0_g1_i1:118-1314(+)
MKVILVLSCILLAIWASCPNQCSGHGICGERDQCTCYASTGISTGQQKGWMGADCSQRTCPMAVAFDAITTHTSSINAPVQSSNTVADALPSIQADSVYTGDADAQYMFKIGAIEVTGLTIAFTRDTTTPAPETLTATVADTFADISVGDQITAAGTPVIVVQKISNSKIIVSADPTANGNITIVSPNGGNGPSLQYRKLPSLDWICLGGIQANGVMIIADGIDLEFTTVGSFAVGDQWRVDAFAKLSSEYDATDLNTAHQKSECSGRGICDRNTGVCGCFDGYTGEACQRTSCPNSCSGHGICQTQKRFSSDNYATAYDAEKQMGCLCDAGFRGPDCSLIECPSGADPLFGDLGSDGNQQYFGRDCSGRGLCDYTSGVCGCFKGYFGERCEYQTNYI